jgi:ATP/maltotriose-dependent transcriptional regulator MalT
MPTAKPQALRHARVTAIRPSGPLVAGQAALARGAWREARRAFRAALSKGESPEALEGLGMAAWWLDDADLVFASRERAFRLYRRRDDRVSAARIAVWLAWDSGAFRGEAHVANGWLQRARRLLDGLPDAPEHAWLAVREGAFALLEDGDPDRALALASEAVRISRSCDHVGYETMGAALGGFALVASGRVAQGMRQLDEVNAAVLGGEVRDPIAIALAGCYLVAACERVRDSRRATQWCRRLKSFCSTWGLTPLLAVCRTQYASVCVWRGDWSEAERELVRATDELLASRPAMSGEGQARLGELRRRQGRLDEAESLFDEAGHHPLAEVGRAALALDRDDAARGAELAERQLRRTPGHNLTQRAAALEVLVRARLTMGSLEKARSAAAALAAIADAIATASLRAASSAAAGLVASRGGDEDGARAHFEDAIEAYEECEAPFEAALVRLETALLLEQQGRMDGARHAVRRALKVLTDLQAARELARARAIDQRLQVPAAASPAPARRRVANLSQREIEVVRLVATGLSNDRIASRLFISGHTVHRHVANVLAKLNVRSRSAIVAKAALLGLLSG